MRIAALVPFKCFTRAKRRLRTAFSDETVEALGRAMLADVLDALGATASLERISVLTDDDEVADAATRGGARARLQQPDPGLNPVIEAASGEALADGFDATLVVLGDLPLLRPSDVQLVLEAGRAHAVVIVPSSDGGTALLYQRPPGSIPACFGRDSAAAHERAARARGFEPLLFTALDERVRTDLDTPEDAERVLESDTPSRTRDVLKRVRG
jgi:2-phospho-L-lactate guanylyltransferase